VGAARVIPRGNNAAAGDVETIHDHKAAEWRDVRVDVEGDGLFGVEGQFSHLVSANLDRRGGRDGVERGGVDDLFDGFHEALSLLGGELELIGPAFGKRTPAEPEHPRLEAGQFEGRACLEGGDNAAFDKNLLFERDADGLAGGGGVRGRGAPALDGFYRADFVCGREDQPVANLDASGFDPPGENAAPVKAINILDRKPQRLVIRDLGNPEPVQRLQHGWAIPPRHVGAAGGDVIAIPGGDRDENLGFEPDGFEPRAVFLLDAAEAFLAVVFQVHFVHEHGDLADAQQVQEVTVPARVFLDAFVSVDQEEGGFGTGGAGDHVFQELLVAGGVNDDVLAFGGSEPDLRRVNGDILIALGLERVHEIGPLEGYAAAFGNGLELLELALGQRAGVMEQAADERGFAVVHVSHDHDLELLRGGGGCGCGAGGRRRCRGRGAFLFGGGGRAGPIYFTCIHRV